MLFLLILQKASSCVKERMLITPSLLIVLIDSSSLHVIAFEKRHEGNQNILSWHKKVIVSHILISQSAPKSQYPQVPNNNTAI